MRYEILFAPEAIEDLKNLRADERSKVRDSIERHLRHEPTKKSKSQIKRLRGLSRPQFRLRIEGVRVFYDVHDDRVEVLAIVAKTEADAWLRRTGERL